MSQPPGLIPPRQKRSAETLARILAGARALLASRELPDISMEEIAAAGGVSIGAIYRRFKSREDLLNALLVDLQLRQLDALDEELAPARWAGVGLAARLDWLADRQGQAARQAPGLVRAILASALAPAQPGDQAAELNARAVDKLAAWLLECEAEITAPDPLATVRVVVAQLSISLHLAQLYPPTFAPLPADTVAPILKRNALAALRG